MVEQVWRPHSHDAADAVDDALAGSGEGIRAVKVSLLGLGLTAALQLAVALSSGSAAVFFRVKRITVAGRLESATFKGMKGEKASSATASGHAGSR